TSWSGKRLASTRNPAGEGRPSGRSTMPLTLILSGQTMGVPRFADPEIGRVRTSLTAGSDGSASGAATTRYVPERTSTEKDPSVAVVVSRESTEDAPVPSRSTRAPGTGTPRASTTRPVKVTAAGRGPRSMTPRSEG